MKKIIIIFLFYLTLFLNAKNNSIDFYKIRNNDLLKIQILPDEKLNFEIRVTEIGTVSLPYLGNISIAGLTIAQAEKIISNKYNSIYYNPSVKIDILKTAPSSVLISGFEGYHNKKLPIGAGETLRKIMIKLGWQDADNYKYSKIIIERDSRNVWEKVILQKLNFDEFELSIEDDDIIFFVKSGLKSITVTGKINKPGTYQFFEKEFIDLRKIMVLCGGLEENSNNLVAVVNRIGSRMEYDLSDLRSFSVELKDNDMLHIEQFSKNIISVSLISDSLKSGVYKIGAGKKIADLIAAAEIILKSDKEYEISVISKINTPIQFKIKDIILHKNSDYNVQLFDEDFVYINEIKKKAPFFFYIYGQVRNQGKYFYTENLSAAEAVLKAGGKTFPGQLSKIKISRNSKEFFIPLTIDSILSNHNQIESGDIIFVYENEKY